MQSYGFKCVGVVVLALCVGWGVSGCSQQLLAAVSAAGSSGLSQ